MAVGRIWQAEWKESKDSRSGVTVKQLTDYKCHSHHLYFTNPGWYDGGRKLLFGSDRENRTNLFGLDLVTGDIVQLTDYPALDTRRALKTLRTCVSPVKDEAYTEYDGQVFALDLNTMSVRALWDVPSGYNISMLNATADGKYVCAGIYEDLSARFRIDLNRGYVGFEEIWNARPHAQIVRIPVDGGAAEIVWEENYWIGHINTSPTQSHLLTFCHEGPWNKVDNRIWGLDMLTGKAWHIRPREAQEFVGHEYWHADGVRVGYHGAWGDGRKFFGSLRYDNSDRIEVPFPHDTGHVHSNDASMIVGDAHNVRLWRWNGVDYDGPRVLCEHRSSFHIQQVHVHPRFSPDGKYVIFTSDTTGYGNVYKVEIQEFDSLPLDEK